MYTVSVKIAHTVYDSLFTVQTLLLVVWLDPFLPSLIGNFTKMDSRKEPAGKYERRKYNVKLGYLLQLNYINKKGNKCLSAITRDTG